MEKRIFQISLIFLVGSFELSATQEFPSETPYELINENCEDDTASVSVTIEGKLTSNVAIKKKMTIIDL